jgi:hypothetical protein
MWIGLALSYAVSALPASTAIIGTAALAYAAAAIRRGLRQRLKMS